MTIVAILQIFYTVGVLPFRIIVQIVLKNCINKRDFLKVINLELQSKEFILVLKLMRTEPQFWSKAYDPVECTVEPLEQSQDWHKVVTICEI